MVGYYRRVFDSGFVCGLVTQVTETKEIPPKLIFKEAPEQDTEVMYRSSTDANLSAVFIAGERLWIQQCFRRRASDVLVHVWGKKKKKDSALQLFPFISPQNCWDLILMLFFLCSFVFSCKNLIVLECFYFIEMSFFLLFPQNCCNYTHVAVSNFFLWKRKEENTKHFLQQCWLSFLFFLATQKNKDAEMCFDKTCIAHVYNEHVNYATTVRFTYSMHYCLFSQVSHKVINLFCFFFKLNPWHNLPSVLSSCK